MAEPTKKPCSLNVPAMALANEVAQLAVNLFDHADSHVGFLVSALHVADLGDSAKGGMLAAAIEMRTLLSQSAEGREALRHFGFEQILEQVERE